MPSQYNQSWTRGFSPWFTGPSSDQHMRVSDAERQAVADRLAEHFSAGRLDQAEFDERVGRAMSAKTRADLNGLFDDLPETGAPAATDPAAGQLRRRNRHPVLLAALIVFVAIAAAHVMWPLLWVGFLIAIVLVATGTIGHARSGQRR
jgi:Flp pilus assembly protein TadB